MNPINKVLPRLDGLKSTRHNKWQALCPAHQDKNPSFAIKEADDGKILLKCWAGCSFESIVSALGLEPQDLFPEKLDRFSESHYQKPQIPKFNKTELFEPLLNAAMLLLIGVNTSAGNPLQNQLFFKESLNDADFVQMVQAMTVIENVFMETKTK